MGNRRRPSITVADRQKLFGAQLGTNEEENEEQAPKEGKLGVTVKPVPAAAAKRLNLQPNQGVLVVDVKPGGFADSVQTRTRRRHPRSQPTAHQRSRYFRQNRIGIEVGTGRCFRGSPGRTGP